MSSVPLSLPGGGSLTAKRRGRLRRWRRWTLFLTVCAVALAACALAWVFMLSPYRLPPEGVRAYEQAAADAARAQGLVWVNTESGVYHRPGTRWYGRTAHGKYRSEWLARLEGNRPALNGQ